MISPASIGLPSYSPRCDDGDDLVERHDDVLEVLPQAQPQREERAGQRARDGDRLALEVVDARRLAGHDHRAVAVAHARAARAEQVLVVQVGVGVDAEAVSSSSPSNARRLSVSMSTSSCVNWYRPVSMQSFARAWNMNASSGSGLWPTRMSCLASAAVTASSSVLGADAIVAAAMIGRVCAGRQPAGLRGQPQCGAADSRGLPRSRAGASGLKREAGRRQSALRSRRRAVGVGAGCGRSFLAGQPPGFALEGEQLQRRVERGRVVVELGGGQLGGRRRRTLLRGASDSAVLPTATLRTSSSTMSMRAAAAVGRPRLLRRVVPQLRAPGGRSAGRRRAA